MFFAIAYVTESFATILMTCSSTGAPNVPELSCRQKLANVYGVATIGIETSHALHRRTTWFLRKGLRHTLAFCSSRDHLVQYLAIRHLSVPLGAGVVKTFRWWTLVKREFDP